LAFQKVKKTSHTNLKLHQRRNIYSGRLEEIVRVNPLCARPLANELAGTGDCASVQHSYNIFQVRDLA